LLISYSLFGQQIELLFSQKNYQKVAERGEDRLNLSGKDLFRIAQSHIKLGNDSLAIEFTNYAKERGHDTWEVDLAAGVAYSNLGNYKEAVKALGKGLEKNDQRKVLWLELAGNLYNDKQMDSAKATYAEIARLWQGDALSNFMICQIAMEIQPSQACIDSFKKRLYTFPKQGQFYQEALEKIAQLEHFVMLDFVEAEKMYDRLITEFPKQKDYLVLKMQLYWYQNKSEEAMAIEKELQDAWYAREVGSAHYKRGKFLIDSFKDAIIRVEIYKSPSKNLGGKPRYEVFVLSINASRIIGKIIINESDSAFIFSGYSFEEPMSLPKPTTYLEIKALITSSLSVDLEKLTP
jgi:tetratricopeptide (TPR) repeat protein